MQGPAQEILTSDLGLPNYANFVLDDADTSNISSTLKSLQARLADVQTSLVTENEAVAKYRKEILVHEQNVADLSSAELKLKKYIVRHQALLQPSTIRNLPSEVLSQIFLHHLDLSIPANLTQVNKQPTYPVTHKNILLAQNLPLRVCRRWRSTAISDPRLWQIVSLFVPSKPDASSLQEHWQRIEERIGYSYSFTIDLLTCRIATLRDATGDPQKMLDLLYKLLPRTRRVFISHIYSYHYIYEKPIQFPNTADVYSHLTEMRISTNQNSNLIAITADWYRSFLTRTPRIRELDAFPLSISSLTTTPRPQLVHLRLHDFTVPDLAALLKNSPQLEGIHLHEITRGEGDIVVAHQEKLSHLRIDVSKATDFLEALSLPGLTHLEFSKQSNDTWPTPASVAFFRRSGCQLKSLLIYNSVISDSIIAVLRLQPTLSVLNFARALSYNVYTVYLPPTPLLDVFGTIMDYLPSLTNFSVAIGAKQVARAQKMLVAVLKTRQRGRGTVTCECDWHIWITMRAQGSGAHSRMRLAHLELFGTVIKELRLYGVLVSIHYQ